MVYWLKAPPLASRIVKSVNRSSLPSKHCPARPLSNLFRNARRCGLACLLVGFFATASIAGQSVNLGMTHHLWGMEDGLPDQIILAIAQTPDGYLWLGTPHGLVRFDGFKFSTISAEVAPTLQEFGVSCILGANDGSLWAGSVGGGVTHLMAHTAEHFATEQGLQALTTRVLYQAADGTIWVGTDKGLYKQVKDRFQFVGELGTESVTSIISDGSDGFWVGSDHLSHYQRGKFLHVTLPPLKSVIRALAIDREGGLWIGSLDKLMVLRKDGSIHVVREVDADVRALFFDQTGRLWIGTIGNSLLMRKKDGRIVRVLNPSEPSRKVMRVIFCTRDGDLWIGTDAGLYRLCHTGMDFLRVSNNRPSDFGSVFVDHNGLVCLSAGNLNCYEGGKKRDVKLPELKGAQFRAVYRDSSGTLWVGTVGNGVYRLAQGGVATHFLGSTAITGFLKAPDGSMWIGTDDGLAHWSHGEFHIFRGGGMNTVKSMTVGRDGSVWVATPAGLFLLRDGEYIRPEVARKLARYRIWSLFGDKDGSLWIGAGTGLYLWRNGSLRHVDLPRSPSRSQAVISILVDASDRFLIAEPTVVFRLSRNSLEHSIATSGKLAADRVGEVHLSSPPEMFAVGSETGTELYSEIPGVATPDSQGGAWYATYQGLLYIGASPLPPHQISPHVAIERVLVDGAPVALSGPIVLPPSVRNVQIQATPILLSSSLGLQLRGRLLGFDDKWNDLVPGSSSSYGRLPPGQYTFAVQAYWRGMNPVSSAQITFVQQSAFYRRKSFIFACCLVLALLGLLLYRTRIHQMKLRFQAVADERSRVAREIHDTLLQGCIGALSLLEALEISHDKTRGNLKSGQENRWLMILQCVREQFGETIKEAREAIWNLRTADDQKPLSEALHDALERLTSRAGVQTSFCVEGEAIPIRPRVQHEIIMSTREAIMNAVSHASPGVIDVHLRFDSSDITVSICDDGIGFDPKEIRMVKSDHFGLCGMRDRMSKLRGSMIVESKLGLGTKVRLSLPVTACRTRVAP